MYKPPFMPLYVDDFEADTTHLSLEEDGVYNRLLRLCWRTAGCSLPDDPKWISRRLRVDIETYHRLVEPILREFFHRENGRVFQGRQRREFQAVCESYKKRASAGAKGGRARKPLQEHHNMPSNAEAMRKPGLSNQNHNQNQIEEPSQEEQPRGSGTTREPGSFGEDAA